jgi:predicted  nucleic acid-binding Zn-ribbon protein
MNEIMKTTQDMYQEINKYRETLKNNQSEINNSISQTNITIKNLVNRVGQFENSVSEQKTKKN